MATNMKSLNGYGFDAQALGGKTLAEIMLDIYPVGAVYISVNSTSPASLFGGKWTQITGRYLIGTGAPELNDDGTSPGDYNYAAESKGGEATHTLTVDEMPSHSHNVTRYTTTDGSTGTGYSRDQNVKTVKDTAYGPYPTGGGQSHNNMPPYLAVYMWKRVS